MPHLLSLKDPMADADWDGGFGSLLDLRSTTTSNTSTANTFLNSKNFNEKVWSEFWTDSDRKPDTRYNEADLLEICD